jgi:hypothetical protein
LLSNELKSNKEQIKVLIEKGKHDDELIEALLVFICGIENYVEMNFKTTIFSISKQKQSQLKKTIDDFNVKTQRAAKEIEETTKEVHFT